MAKVYVKFPKAGLGNLLLVWAKAKLFAEINGLELITASWWGFRWGAWFRNEKKKRMYMGYFCESSLVSRIETGISQSFIDTVQNPAIKKLSEAELKKRTLFVFDAISTGDDIFLELRESSEYIKSEVYKLLQPSLRRRLDEFPEPEIAVHIRRGDFKIANQTTDLSFFCDCIKSVRKVIGKNLPVTIFTDAPEEELYPVLQLPLISIAENKPDILDILLMSKSKIIILSKSSTFSYWAAFLSNAVVLRPLGDWQKQIRSNSTTTKFAEIDWKINDQNCLDELKQALKKAALSQV